MSAHEGSTPAAWTAVVLVILGFVLGAIGLVVARPAAIYLGVGVVVLGGIAGKVLQLMGFGSQRA